MQVTVKIKTDLDIRILINSCFWNVKPANSDYTTFLKKSVLWLFALKKCFLTDLDFSRMENIDYVIIP